MGIFKKYSVACIMKRKVDLVAPKKLEIFCWPKQFLFPLFLSLDVIIVTVRLIFCIGSICLS